MISFPILLISLRSHACAASVFTLGCQFICMRKRNKNLRSWSAQVSPHEHLHCRAKMLLECILRQGRRIESEHKPAHRAAGDQHGFDGDEDHVHLLVNYHPKVAVSVLVNSLKGESSRALWSPSYFAGSCGGAPVSVIRRYIEQQQPPR